MRRMWHHGSAWGGWPHPCSYGAVGPTPGWWMDRPSADEERELLEEYIEELSEELEAARERLQELTPAP
jgi:hypothetical protein